LNQKREGTIRDPDLSLDDDDDEEEDKTPDDRKRDPPDAAALFAHAIPSLSFISNLLITAK
jgi:hypothetical protein